MQNIFCVHRVIPIASIYLSAKGFVIFKMCFWIKTRLWRTGGNMQAKLHQASWSADPAWTTWSNPSAGNTTRPTTILEAEGESPCFSPTDIHEVHLQRLFGTSFPVSGKMASTVHLELWWVRWGRRMKVVTFQCWMFGRYSGNYKLSGKDRSRGRWTKRCGLWQENDIVKFKKNKKRAGKD